MLRFELDPCTQCDDRCPFMELMKRMADSDNPHGTLTTDDQEILKEAAKTAVSYSLRNPDITKLFFTSQSCPTIGVPGVMHVSITNFANNLEES